MTACFIRGLQILDKIESSSKKVGKCLHSIIKVGAQNVFATSMRLINDGSSVSSKTIPGSRHRQKNLENNI